MSLTQEGRSGPLHKKDQARRAGHVFLGGSLRGVVQWLCSGMNPGTERTSVWDPLGQRKSGPEAKL